MNARKILFSAVLLAVAIGVIVLINALSNSKSSTDSVRLFPGASTTTIGSVMLRDASDQVNLLRRDDAWAVVPRTAQAKAASGSAAAEYPADTGAIGQLFETLVKIRTSTTVSENPAKQATFEVDSLHGTRIEVFDLSGKSLGAVIMGKSSSDYGSNYFRFDHSNQVYLVPESNRWSLTADHKHWEDKAILKFDLAQAKELTIAKKGSPTLVISRGDSVSKGWQLVEGGKVPLDSNKVAGVLGVLAALQADEFEDSAYTDSATGLAAPQLTLIVKLSNGSSRTVAIGSEKPGQNKYWLRIPEKQFVYLINDGQYKQLDKKPEDLANLPPKPEKPVKPASKPSILGKIKLPAKK